MILIEKNEFHIIIKEYTKYKTIKALEIFQKGISKSQFNDLKNEWNKQKYYIGKLKNLKTIIPELYNLSDCFYYDPKIQKEEYGSYSRGIPILTYEFIDKYIRVTSIFSYLFISLLAETKCNNINLNFGNYIHYMNNMFKEIYNNEDFDIKKLKDINFAGYLFDINGEIL